MANPRHPRAMAQKGAAEFFSHVEKQPDGCWLWTGPLTSVGSPYGRYNGERMIGCDAAWLIEQGSLPEGHRLKRTCGHRNCVSPAHHVARPTVATVAPEAHRLWLQGMTHAEVGRHLGFGEKTIARALSAHAKAAMGRPSR